MNDCYDISILPNYNEHCWLNTILMCVLYSQYSRDMLINHSIHWKDDIFLNIIRNIINSYYSNKKNIEVFYNSIVPARLLYEIVLQKSTSATSRRITSSDLKELSWTEYNIMDFYRFLGISCVDVIYARNKYLMNYLSRKQYSGSEPPEVVVLFHEELTNVAKHHSKEHQSSGDSGGRFVLNSKKAGTISSYADEIEFLGTTYVLSSCVINNQKEGYRYHTTAGVICNGKKLVYNSYINKGNNPCSLINFDWDVKKNQEMCLNPYDCELSFTYNIKRVNDLCFSFGSGNRYLVYVQKSKATLTNITLKKEEIKEVKPEPVVKDITEEVKKIKEMTDIGLYSEYETIRKTPINIKNIKTSDRDKLEKFVLESRLKALSTVKEVIPEKLPSPVPPEIENTEGEQAPPPEPPVEGEEEKKDGGMLKKATKKELLLAITKKLNGMKKNKLVSLYSNLKSNH